jgi:hypothetical protein
MMKVTTKHGYEPRNSVSSAFVYFAPALSNVEGLFVVNVSASAMSCKNQTRSNQIRLNPTKLNHIFFRETACRGYWRGVAGGIGSLFVFAVKNSCLQNFDSFFSDNSLLFPVINRSVFLKALYFNMMQMLFFLGAGRWQGLNRE